jgi:large subunit ribosomal protein L41e
VVSGSKPPKGAKFPTGPPYANIIKCPHNQGKNTGDRMKRSSRAWKKRGKQRWKWRKKKMRRRKRAQKMRKR